MKTLFVAGCLGGCVLLSLAGSAVAEPVPRVLAFVESKPVMSDNLEFVTEVETDWAWPHAMVKTPVLIQLRMTNKGAADVVFRTFDSFRLVMVDPKGNTLSMAGGRDETMVTEDVVIHPGQTFTLTRQATFILGRESDFNPSKQPAMPKLSYLDGTGTQSIYTLREPGDYQLKFVLTPSPLTSSPAGKAAGKTVWKGNAQTEAVVFHLHPARDLRTSGGKQTSMKTVHMPSNGNAVLPYEREDLSTPPQYVVICRTQAKESPPSPIHPSCLATDYVFTNEEPLDLNLDPPQP